MRDSKNKLGEQWIDKTLHYMEKNRLQTFYNFVLIVVIALMLPAFTATLDGTTVEVDLPPRGKIVVTNNSANKLYYDLWTEHYTNNKEYIEEIVNNEKIPLEFTFSIVDFSYANIEQKYGEYLKRYKPSKLIKERHLFAKFVKNVKVKMISQKFIVESMKTELSEDGGIAESIINGVAYQNIAGVELDPRECEYKFMYERIGGKIYGTSLQTNCF